MQGFLSDKVRYRLEDLVRCGCDSEPLGDLLKQFELDETHTFRLFIKPFMDALTWDEDRIDRCCTHVIRPDGKLESFHFAFGKDDFYIIVDLPGNTSAAAVALAVGATGAVGGLQTVVLLTPEEVDAARTMHPDYRKPGG